MTPTPRTLRDEEYIDQLRQIARKHAADGGLSKLASVHLSLTDREQAVAIYWALSKLDALLASGQGSDQGAGLAAVVNDTGSSQTETASYKGPRDVFCPSCGAEAGSPCHSEMHHMARLKLSDAMNARRDWMLAENALEAEGRSDPPSSGQGSQPASPIPSSPSVECGYCREIIQPRDPFHVHGHNECLCGMKPRHNAFLHVAPPSVDEAITELERIARELNTDYARAIQGEVKSVAGNWLAGLRSSITALEAVSASYEQEIARLQKEIEFEKAWSDTVTRGKSPCGHWSAYAHSIDAEGKGRLVDCWQCRAERAEAALAKRQETEDHAALLRADPSASVQTEALPNKETQMSELQQAEERVRVRRKALSMMLAGHIPPRLHDDVAEAIDGLVGAAVMVGALQRVQHPTVFSNSEQVDKMNTGIPRIPNVWENARIAAGGLPKIGSKE